MAVYNKLLFALDRGRAQTNSDLDQVAIHTFKDTSLSLSTIETSGFFPAYFGFSDEEIKENDLLYIIGSDVDKVDVVKILDPSTASLSSTLFQRWSYGTLPNILFSGPAGWGAGIATDVDFNIVGDLISLSFPTVLGNSATNNNITATLPGAGTLLNDLYFSIPVINNPSGAISPGSITISSGGAVFIAPYAALSGVPGNYGFNAFTICYRLAVGI